MDTIVSVIGESPIIQVELTPLAISVVLSETTPQATVTLLNTVEPPIVEVKPDLPYYVQVYEWPDCPEGPPGIQLPIDALDVLYHNIGYANLSDVQKALDYLLYVNPQITSLTVNIGSQEIGSIVNDVTLSWQYNKAMTTANLTDTGSISPTLLGLSFTGLGLTATKTWNLTVSDGKNQTSKGVSIQFLFKRYWGVSSNQSLSSADMLSLNGELASSRIQSRSIDGAGKYIYFAWPISWGAPVFKVNGLQSTAWVQSVISHTNSKGYVSNYVIYRSTTIQHGSGVQIEVI